MRRWPRCVPVQASINLRIDDVYERAKGRPNHFIILQASPRVPKYTWGFGSESVVQSPIQEIDLNRGDFPARVNESSCQILGQLIHA